MLGAWIVSPTFFPNKSILHVKFVANFQSAQNVNHESMNDHELPGAHFYF